MLDERDFRFATLLKAARKRKKLGPKRLMRVWVPPHMGPHGPVKGYFKEVEVNVEEFKPKKGDRPDVRWGKPAKEDIKRLRSDVARRGGRTKPLPLGEGARTVGRVGGTPKGEGPGPIQPPGPKRIISSRGLGAGSVNTPLTGEGRYKMKKKPKLQIDEQIAAQKRKKMPGASG